MILLISLCYAKVHSQSIVKEKTYGNSDMDAAFDIKALANGGFIIVGNKGSVGATGFGSGDIYILKTDANGDTIWTKTYGGKYDESASSVTVLPDGGFAVTGFESTNTNTSSRNIFAMKLDSNGNKLWKKSYGGNADDEGNEIKQSSDGGFIIAGLTESYGAGSRDAYLIKTNSNGDTLWTKTFGKEKFDDSWDVELTKDGGYILTGGSYSYASGAFDDAWLIKTDANGNKQWIKNYGISDKVDWAWSLTPIRSGGFAFVGVKNTSETGMDRIYGNLYFVKVDDNGNVVWDKSIHAPYRLEGTDIQETKDNGFIICGYGIDMQGQSLYILKTNSLGEPLWSKSIGNPSTLSRANGITETSNGGFVVVGYNSKDFNASSQDIYFVKIMDVASKVDETTNIETNVVEIFPNPAQNELSISSNIMMISLDIIDAFGKIIEKKTELKAIETKIDISNLSDGNYTVLIHSSCGDIIRKLIISRY